VKVEEVDEALIEHVCARVHERLRKDDARQAEAFVRQYYRWVPHEDLADRAPLDVYGAALAHLNLARRRAPGETKLRVYDPRFETHGWQSTHTAVEIVSDDMPFLVDSVRMELARRGASPHLLIHPVVVVRRDEDGTLLEVLPPQATVPEGAIAESVIHVEVDRVPGREELDALAGALRRVLGDVGAAVEDWGAMRSRLLELARELAEHPPPSVDEEQVTEAHAFLRWLADDHFTLLGFRAYDLGGDGDELSLTSVPESGLGILRQSGGPRRSRAFEQLPPAVRAMAREPTVLNITKANSRATVHRPAYLDYVGVKRFDDAGRVVGERRFLGLYTHTAYRATPREIPILRRRHDAVLARAAFPPGSHDEKALVDILEEFPRDELFQVGEEELFEIAMGILHLGERQRVRLFVRRDAFGRFLSCLVFVPRDRFNTDNRMRIERILRDAFAATGMDYSTRVSESPLIRLHFIAYTDPAHPPEIDVAAVEARIVSATRSWADDLAEALVEEHGEADGGALRRRYGDAFPPAYRADWVARSAVADIGRLEALGEDGLSMSLYRPLEAPPGTLRAKVFRAGAPLALSDMVPMLEHLGVVVADERPYEIRPRDAPSAWIYDFGLTYGGADELETERVRELVRDAFVRVWRGDAEDDGYNRLVLRAGLPWREVAVLRAVARYLRQAGTTFSDQYVQDALVSRPQVATGLVRLFRARFDPAREQRDDVDALVAEVSGAIDAVESLDQDQILRRFLDVVRAMLRTNHFRPEADGRSRGHLSFKLDSARLPWLPQPRPAFEIFVYAPRVEGVHLRGGKVARGGIRWSDRREDFRTEVLGLMKAQMVKNAVIVPVGAKGGFVVKRPGDEVVECYRTFIRGLLDVTDTIAGGEVVPPPHVVRYDGDDPYLVVAADKGTATFSDVANAIAREEGFWLGDAFASGGATGYDHKRMGITARGAWEAVKRHFRELGRDVQAEPFTVAGIGDMSGDVFGNAMLLSPHIRLVAAFDHRHVFLDPDPDPEAGLAERRRLFALERSSWADYDRAALSAGGGVFSRSAKSIRLSPEARAALGVEAEALPPGEVIRAILRAPVDLLFNGGIGTYVKASRERHGDVGDKANDHVRVDAAELRCRAVGEGGNLGLTQAARVEYALAGGRINTDAIDNSGGVDCSDREVNIKILLDAAVANGDLTVKQRNAVLAEATDAVADLVLRDSYEQTETLTLAEAQAADMLDVHRRLIRSFERTRGLDRALEGLPAEAEIAERKAARRGLTRPELATLLAHAKIGFYAELVESDLADDPYLDAELRAYFPAPLPERFAPWLPGHRLRREIAATQISNNLHHGGGITFAFRLREEIGAPAPDVARAYAIARDVFALRPLWAAIEELDTQVDTAVQTAMLLAGRRLLERATRWLLRNRPRPLDISGNVAELAPGAAALSESLSRLLDPSDAEPIARRADELREAGVPEALAGRIAGLPAMLSALDIVDVAARTELDLEPVARVHFRLGSRLQLHWLRDRITELPRDDRWRALARAALRDELFALHRVLTAEVLSAGPPDAPADERVEEWVRANPSAERHRQTLDDIRLGRVYDETTLAVAVSEVRNLLGVHPAAR